jgi:hypothetical protein
MLRLTTLNAAPHPAITQLIQKILPPDTLSPQTIIRDVWDFGDSIIVGNKTTNTIKSWEVVDRYCIALDNNEIYVDLLAENGGIGHGPCERQTQEVSSITVDEYILDRTNTTTQLNIPVQSPYDIDGAAVATFIETADMKTPWLKANTVQKSTVHKKHGKRLPTDRQKGTPTIPLIIRANSSEKISKRK